MRSNFRNTALSSLQGVSLAASSALSCKNYPRKYKSTFYQELVLKNKAIKVHVVLHIFVNYGMLIYKITRNFNPKGYASANNFMREKMKNPDKIELEIF